MIIVARIEDSNLDKILAVKNALKKKRILFRMMDAKTPKGNETQFHVRKNALGPACGVIEHILGPNQEIKRLILHS